MNPLRENLIDLARIMPEPALWTACEVLKAIRDAQAELDAAEASVAERRRPVDNVLSIDARRARRSKSRTSTSSHDARAGWQAP